MAKLQDYIAKRKELQATNPNASLADARQALSPPTANAPVAGQPPPVQPIAQPVTPIQPTNQQIRENNQARVQADIALGDIPQVGQQATPPQAPEIIPQAQIQTAQANPKGGAFAFENSTSAQNPENLAWVQQQVDSGKMTKDQAWEKVFAERVYGVDKNPATISQQVQDMPMQKPVDIPKQLSIQDQATIDRMTAEGRFGVPTTETQPLPKTETALTDKGVQKAPATTTEVQPQPITIGDMYNNLVNIVDVPPEQKALPTYKIAQNRYNKASLYSGMTESQLSNEMKSGKLIEGSTAWEDIKAMNPKLAKKTQDLNNVNNVKPEIFTYVNNPDGTTTKKNNLADTFVTDYEDNYGDIVKALRDIYNPDTAQQIKDAIYTPEVKQAEEKATAIEEEMNALSDQIENIDKEVEEEFKGSGATGSRKALEKSSRTDKLNKDYNSLLKRYTSYANIANNLITQNTDIYNSTQAQKAQMQQALAGVATKQFETELATQQKIREQQIADQLAVQAQNDPTKAIPLLVEQYTKLGIPMQRSTQGMIQEAQNVIANGGNLADYLTELQGKIQSKPEYQAILAKKAGEGTSYVQYGDKVYKNVNGVLTLTDISAKSTPAPVWQEWTDSNGVSHAEWITPGVNPTTSTGVKGTGNIVPVTAGGKTVRLDQVGASGFENAVNQLTANGTPIVIGQGERDQVATIKSMAEKAGIPFNASNPAETAGKLRAKGMQVADPGKSNHESGMAIDVYGSSKLDAVTPEQEKILNANGWYSAGIPGDAGHFEYKGTAGTQTNGQYSDEQINNLAYLVELQEKNPSEASKQMKELGYKAQDMANYKAGNMPLTEKQKNSSIEVMDAIKQLADPTKYEWNDAVGFLAGTPSLSGGDASTATMAIDNLVAKLTLPNLGVLKGPMSDKDIAFIKEASSKLSRDQSDASFERNLIDAYNLSARRAGMPEIKKLSDISNPTATVGGEKSYSKYE